MSAPSSDNSAAQQREREGLLLLQELRELQGAGVSQEQLNALAVALRDFASFPLGELIRHLEQLAREKLGDQRPLLMVLARHANGMQGDADVPPLCAHFERLALLAALLSVMPDASARLPGGGR